ncbi:MAG TPA: hypothetical protein PKL67_08415 [Anaerolineae bacterium]|nr:hypothetical protein [Anaerolineae bacterium]
MSLTQRIKAIFRRAWRAYGQPSLLAAPPLDAWTLPPSYSYSAAHDGIRTGSGETLNDLDAFLASGYFAGETVYIVPVQDTDELRSMAAAGIVPDGTLELYVLAADLATVRSAFAVQINGLWYDVAAVGAEPSGAGDTWARVRLRRRA